MPWRVRKRAPRAARTAVASAPMIARRVVSRCGHVIVGGGVFDVRVETACGAAYLIHERGEKATTKVAEMRAKRWTAAG